MSAYGHTNYSISRVGKLCARNARGTWETSETLSLVAAYLESVRRLNANENSENRAGFFRICETLEGFRKAVFEDYIGHLDAIAPGWRRDEVTTTDSLGARPVANVTRCEPFTTCQYAAQRAG